MAAHTWAVDVAAAQPIHPRHARNAIDYGRTLNGNEPPRGIQRWRHRRHHYHYGAGDEGPPRGEPADTGAGDPAIPQLHPELRLPGHLLEQPPPHAACDTKSHGRDVVGESAPPVLAVSHTVRDRLDGRKPFRGPAVIVIWGCAPDVRYRVLDPGTIDHCVAGSGLHPQKGCRTRLERRVVADPLRHCHSCSVLVAMGFIQPICCRGVTVAHSGSTHRKHFAECGTMTASGHG